MQNKKPLIGITLDYGEGGPSPHYSPRPYYALREDYSNSIIKAGGIPIFLSYDVSLIDNYISMIDGLLMPGGDYDIDPAWYGEENLYSLVNNKRFDFEKLLLKEAIEKQLPILGICAGFQLMNVCYGGSLFQNIKKQHSDLVNHSQTEDMDKTIHEISVKENSLLHKITGKEKILVNSHHRQGIKAIGSNLKATAHALDGIPEAIELENYPFALGVEWHPEYMATEEDVKIMQAFIDEARKTINE